MKLYEKKHINVYFFLILTAIFNQITFQQAYLTDCHYSCLYCLDIDYAQCVICQPGLELIPLSEITNKTDINAIKIFPSGSCIQEFSFFQFNVLGVVFTSFLVLTLIISRNRMFFYYISSFQTLGLLSLLEIGYLNPLGYILQSFEWFMPFASIQKLFQSYTYEFYYQGRYRLGLFLYETDIQKNLFLIGPVQLSSFAVVLLFSIVIWIYEAQYESQEQIQKKEFNKERRTITFKNKIQKQSLCKSILIKIQYFFMTIFFLTIQQTILILAVGFRYSQIKINVMNIIIGSSYIIILIVMTVIHFRNDLPLFSNKIIQMTEILKKIIFSLFVILPTSLCYFIFFFMFFMNLIQIYSVKNLNIKNKIINSSKKIQKITIQYLKNQQQLKRQIWYRLLQLISIVGIGTFYAVNRMLNESSSSQYSSYVALGCLCVFSISPLIQIFMQIKSIFKIQQSLIPQNSQNINILRLNNREAKLTKEDILITSQGFVQNSFLNKTQEQIFQKQQWKKNNRKQNKRKQRQAKKQMQTLQTIVNVDNDKIQQKKDDAIVQIDSYQNIITTKRSQKTKLYTHKQKEELIIQQKYSKQSYAQNKKYQNNTKTFYDFKQERPIQKIAQKNIQQKKANKTSNKLRKARKFQDIMSQN